METATRANLAQLLETGTEVFLIGIGGVGMSALAKVLAARGLTVKGSDLKGGAACRRLSESGITIFEGHDSAHLGAADWVVYSSAISKDNPEWKRAEAQGISVYHRAEVLAFLMNQAISIAVTGTHGKTTSSAFTSFLLTQAGFRPTCLVGGEILNFGTNAILGDSHLFVAEVDESDRSQLYYTPDFALITNLEADHLDVYQDLNDIKKSFRMFMEQVRHTGRVIYGIGDPNLCEVMKEAKTPGAVSYGLSLGADFYANDIALDGLRSKFVLYERGKKIESIHLGIPGLHNVVNTLGVIALVRTFGMRYDRILPHLKDFRGVARRLEVKLATPGLMVVDDYAHHPTEVRASLGALRSLGKRTTAVFQPHRFSRTLHLASEFSQAFESADRVVLTDIYGAGEENTGQVKVNSIYDAVKSGGHPDVHIVNRSHLVNFLMDRQGEQEIIAFLGAGDIGEIASEFAGRFKSADSN